MKKIWKPVVIDMRGQKTEYPYTISNYGEIKNRHGRALKSFLRGKRKGVYPCVDLYLRGEGSAGRYRVDVHRLVAFHFVPNPDNKPEVNHLDLNNMNYRADNLEWCTRQENEMHKHFMLGTGEFHNKEGV